MKPNLVIICLVMLALGLVVVGEPMPAKGGPPPPDAKGEGAPPEPVVEQVPTTKADQLTSEGITRVARSTVPPQRFLREPFDQTEVLGGRATLPCRVANKKGVLQWTRDGFGLGTERNLTGFDRYTMTGSDEEGE